MKVHRGKKLFELFFFFYTNIISVVLQIPMFKYIKIERVLFMTV